MRIEVEFEIRPDGIYCNPGCPQSPSAWLCTLFPSGPGDARQLKYDRAGEKYLRCQSCLDKAPVAVDEDVFDPMASDGLYIGSVGSDEQFYCFELSAINADTRDGYSEVPLYFKSEAEAQHVRSKILCRAVNVKGGK